MAFMDKARAALGIGRGGKTADIKARIESKQKTSGVGIAGRVLADIDPSQGDKSMTRAEVLELFEDLGYRGTPQGFRSDSDAVSDADTDISTEGDFYPGGAAVHIFGTTGSSTDNKTYISRPTNVSVPKLGGRSLLDGNPMPFMPMGRGWVALIPFGEKGGKTYTATANCTFATGDSGTVETLYFDDESEARAFLAVFTAAS